MPHFICSPILCLTTHSLKKTPCVLHIWWHMGKKKTPWVLSIWCHMCKKSPWVLNISCIMERSHYVFADDSLIIAEWRFFLLAGCWVTADWMEVKNTSCIFCFAQGCSYALHGNGFAPERNGHSVSYFFPFLKPTENHISTEANHFCCVMNSPPLRKRISLNVFFSSSPPLFFYIFICKCHCALFI